MNIINYKDFDFLSLKIQLEKIELEINKLINKKTELEELFKDFYFSHSKELGSLTLEILRLRKLKFKYNSFKYKKALEDEQNYEHELRANDKSKLEISELEKQKLKKKFRKACLLCHPDKFQDDNKIYAQQIFINLKESYDRNDIVQVELILNKLENGIFNYDAKKYNEIELIEYESSLKLKIAEKLKSEIIELESHELFEIIKDNTKWEFYFSKLKLNLEKELEILNSQIKQ